MVEAQAGVRYISCFGAECLQQFIVMSFLVSSTSTVQVDGESFPFITLYHDDGSQIIKVDVEGSEHSTQGPLKTEQLKDFIKGKLGSTSTSSDAARSNLE
jgi:hypothetical protein